MYLTRPRSKKPRVLYNDDTAFEALSAETSLCAGERCRDRPDERRQGDLDIHGENIPLLHTFSSPSCAGLWRREYEAKNQDNSASLPGDNARLLVPCILLHQRA
jgi:hypothetical protein